jgi:iron complex transport system substrate-binding protein
LRIVCLTGETADLCARLGAWDDVVAVSAYATQSGLTAKPVASGFSSGGAEFILKFQPDLVLGFSDVQADLAAA